MGDYSWRQGKSSQTDEIERLTDSGPVVHAMFQLQEGLNGVVAFTVIG